MASFNIDYQTADEAVKTGHRINVEPTAGETDWEALIRVVQARGLKLLRARTADADIMLEVGDASIPVMDMHVAKE